MNMIGLFNYMLIDQEFLSILQGHVFVELLFHQLECILFQKLSQVRIQ